MQDRRDRLFALGLLVALFIGQWGCAAAPVSVPYDVAPPSEEVRAHLGTVGVAAAGRTPDPSLKGPTNGKGQGAAKVAGAWALGVAVIYPLAPVGLALAPIFAVAGAIWGAIEAEPAARVAEAEAALTHALPAQDAREAIKERILGVARGQTNPDLLPSVARVDTTLEVSVPTLGLKGPIGQANPPLSLVVRACVRLIRTADGVEIYPAGPAGARPLAYASLPRKLLEWSADDARLFRAELASAYQGLAEKIVEHVFLVYRSPGPRWSEIANPPPLGSETCPAARVKASE